MFNVEDPHKFFIKIFLIFIAVIALSNYLLNIASYSNISTTIEKSNASLATLLDGADFIDSEEMCPRGTIKHDTTLDCPYDADFEPVGEDFLEAKCHTDAVLGDAILCAAECNADYGLSDTVDPVCKLNPVTGRYFEGCPVQPSDVPNPSIQTTKFFTPPGGTCTGMTAAELSDFCKKETSTKAMCDNEEEEEGHRLWVTEPGSCCFSPQ